MGNVFTVAQVRAGRIPDPAAFRIAERRLKQGILQEPAIIAAVVCGSVLRGDHNRRSDIDCAVLYDTTHAEQAIRFMQEEVRAGASTCTPINFIPVDTTLAQTRLHHFGRSFAHHVKISALNGGTVKGDLTSALALTMSLEDEIFSYLSAKIYKLETGWTELRTYPEERTAAYLKKVLEAPMHVARKALRLREYTDMDSKRDVEAAYLRFAPPKLAGAFSELLTIDRWYTEVIDVQARAVDAVKYAQELASLEEAIPLSIEFAKMNASWLDSTTRP
jgi:hypothetical protein